MTNYRRIFVPGATWFFTVNLEGRHNNHLLVENIDLLRAAFRYVKQRKFFQVEAVVIMPDHLHCIWTLLPEETDFSIRWNMLKGYFSHAMPRDEKISTSRRKRRERGVWQRRFWAHLITDQADFNNHVDYIHWNPVKHGVVERVVDWPHSSFHRYVAEGYYPADWGHSGVFDIPMSDR
jgi:putative transposase